ncbi:tyrosinase family oxidase copper chaperone [Actinoplanes couchii]|uniref:Uncharacterized protein n=1 Tax=Actinoplanes couchii TaxID=403638 RepID=A0ABQ3XK97_9ACTN|nr:tyrosinase family oxidase copper chaperone [Actinoplanes couchii]MDR6320516.1 hypothetical protein [Actinoplanes couchii]GID58921.1 hypothetical protein Aco03nite_073250 [Actinoplanes couchii]
MKISKQITVLIATAGALAAAGTAMAATTAVSSATVSAPDVDQAPRKTGFYENYHGVQIMGWGSGKTACSYVDGIRLVVYPQADGQYTSAVVAFKPEKSVRNITKATVKVLDGLKLAHPEEPSATCPDLLLPVPAATPSTSAPASASASPSASASVPASATPSAAVTSRPAKG